MGSEPTLLNDLEAAADVLRLREANDIQPPLDSTLGARLRAAAARLREEWARWEGDMDGGGGVVARINGGPLR